MSGKVINFTEARIHALKLGSGIWRDEQVKGMLVVCHRTSKTYAVQGDVRRNGRFIRTVRVKIDRCDRIGLREARRRAMGLMSQIQSGVDPAAKIPETGFTIEKILELYQEARQLAPSTAKSYTTHVNYYLKKWKNRAIADITRTDVRELYEELKAKRGQTTAAHVMRTLRALINEACRIDETMTSNPVSAALRIPMNKSRQVPPLDMAAWWETLQTMPSMRRDIHIFLMFTGLRRRSATTILRDDVNLENATVYVRHMKSGRPFHLPLSDFLVDMLRKRMEEDVPLNLTK